MIQVERFRLSSVMVHEFYEDKIPRGVLKPSNDYQIYIIKINNPDDRLYEYSELVLIETTHGRYYPVIMLNINISNKYSAYMCDIKCETEQVDKETLIHIIPARHMKRLAKILDKL